MTNYINTLKYLPVFTLKILNTESVKGEKKEFINLHVLQTSLFTIHSHLPVNVTAFPETDVDVNLYSCAPIQLSLCYCNRWFNSPDGDFFGTFSWTNWLLSRAKRSRSSTTVLALPMMLTNMIQVNVIT